MNNFLSKIHIFALAHKQPDSMIFDIHTHHKPTDFTVAIQSLTVSEAEKQLTPKAEGLYSVGIHPWYISDNYHSDLQMLKNHASNKRVVLIGECGLDKNSKATASIQIQVFKAQVKLSEELQKPLIIHCVGYFNELLTIKKDMNPQQLWIVHGFRGKPQLATQLLKAGCALSFGEKYNEDSVRVTPIEKLYIETDESTVSIETIYRKIAVVKAIAPNNLMAGTLLLEKLLS